MSSVALFTGARVYDVFELREAADRIISTVQTKDTREFIEMTRVQDDVFPDDYKVASAAKAARFIYDKKRDFINVGDFRRLVKAYSTGLLSEIDPELDRLYILGKTAAMLKRAGIERVTLATVERMYLSLPARQRMYYFTQASRGAHNGLDSKWGEDCFNRLIVGEWS